MKYLVVMKGEGEGCDYIGNIACNEHFYFLHAGSFEEAKADAVRDAMEYSDPPVIRLMIVPAEAVVDLTDELQTAKASLHMKRDKEQRETQDARDKAEFERLKAKFGN